MADQCEEEIKKALQHNDQAVAAEKTKEYFYRSSNIPLNIAITGESGSGKSTLVNSLRGIKNKTEGAAPTGTKETTMEPTEYLHPKSDNIRIWDLPGVGTTNFTADKYLQHVGFEKYDFFIIVSSDRFRKNDAKLAKEIQKKKKKFYFVRSKIDQNIRDEKKENPDLNEENLLKLIRDDCSKELQVLGFESPKVFLVSGLRLHLYEFRDLWKIIEEEHQMIIPLQTAGIMVDQCKEDVTTALQNNDLPQAAQKALEYLNELNNVPLNIGITGESGSGKSSLINALRGIKNKTKGAAPTGAVETTMEPTEYRHPQNDKIKMWDLPGIGTVKFTARDYIKKMDFKKFDFFIIVSNDRFRENDANLAKEIQKMKKKFYFIRSKIDNSVRDEKDSDPDFNEEDLLKLIRDNCTKGLQDLGIKNPKVFLVSSLRLDQYEFGDMWKTLEEELPEHQRDALLLALPNISLDVIKQKKKVLGDKMKWYALASAFGAAVPVPGLSEVVDLGLIMQFANECLKSLGLRPESLKKLSYVTSVPYEDLRKELKTLLASSEQLTKDVMLRVLAMSSTHITAIALEEGVRFVPFVGIPIAMGLSSFTAYKILTYTLDTLTEDAQRVFMKAMRLESNV